MLLDFGAARQGKAVMPDVTNPSVYLMIVADAEGLALLPSEPGVAGSRSKVRDYFKEAVKGRPFETAIIVGATTGKRGMFYANPVFDPRAEQSDRCAGAGAEDRGIDHQHHCRVVHCGTARVPFMVDGDRILIHYPGKGKLHKSLHEFPRLPGRAARPK